MVNGYLGLTKSKLQKLKGHFLGFMFGLMIGNLALTFRTNIVLESTERMHIIAYSSDGLCLWGGGGLAGGE